MATHVFLVVTTIPGFDSIKTEDVSKVIMAIRRML